jgi:hypothetical protein
MMSWLSDYQLTEKIKRNGNDKLKCAFYGVYPIDSLPEFVPHIPLVLIVNTHPHNLQGEHWKAVFINEDRCGEVFDSLAEPLSNLLIQWMNRFTRKWKTNRKRYQLLRSSTCGAFVLYFIFNRFVLPSLDSVTDTFSYSPSINECKVLNFYKRLK